MLGFLGIGRVALRRRQAGSALQSTLSSVLDNAPVGLGFLDHGMRLRHMNRSLLGILHQNEEADGAAVASQPLWDILPGSRPVLEPALRRTIERGRVVGNLELHVPGHDGIGERDLLVGFFPTLSEAGTGPRPAGADLAGLVVTDVTLRKRAERRVKESEERFRALVNSAVSIVWVANADGAFDREQARWMAFTGQTPQEHLDRGWADAVHPEDRAGVLSAWEESVRTHTPYRLEHRMRRADGAWRTMEAMAVPLKEDGAVREWVGTHTDITERREAEDELSQAKEAAEQANRAKSQFLANMSHELRTPLSAVIGYSEMIEEEMVELGQTELLDDLRKINSNARHLLSLINDVLEPVQDRSGEDDHLRRGLRGGDPAGGRRGDRRRAGRAEGQRAGAGPGRGARVHAHGPGQAAAVPVQPGQ